MSKAFTKDDDAGEAPLFVSRRPPLPPGAPNYVTMTGLEALRAELSLLTAARRGLERGSVAGEEPARSTAIAHYAELEGRIASAVLVDVAQQPHEEVRFGARVRVRDAAGELRSYRIVGVDEADPQQGALAFVAPRARALLGKRVGEIATVITPTGEDQLEVVAIDYSSSR